MSISISNVNGNVFFLPVTATLRVTVRDTNIAAV